MHMSSKLQKAALSLAHGLFLCACWIIHFALSQFNKGKGKTVPPIRNPLLLKSATALAQDIREGKTKSEDVVRAYTERIKEVEPFINATAECVFEEALSQAKQVDVMVASGEYTERQLAEDKPLLGVPCTVKVYLTVKGLLSTCGSKFHQDVRATEDSPCVYMLRNAGAIVLATTNCPESCLHLETSNLVHGRTKNPYNTSRTSGGSSGGESALLAAGGSVIGLGNDLQGSIRLPCHFTGLFGHKPSRGLVANHGTYPVLDDTLGPFVCTGPMCRYAVDLQTTMKLLSLNSDIGAQFQKKVDFKKLKIYYMTEIEDILVPPIEKDILMSMKKAITYFRTQYGSKAIKISIPSMKNTNFFILHMLMSNIKDIKHTITDGKGDHINEKIDLLKYFLGKSHFSIIPLIIMNFANRYPLYSENRLPYYHEMLKTMTKEFEDLLVEDSVLFFPTFPVTAPYHHEIVTHFPSLGYTGVFNFLGLSATQCPLGLDKEGLPCGMQIVGRHNADALTVACAVELEKVFGGWIPPGQA